MPILHRYSVCVALAALLAIGCGEELGQASGELGTGTFLYECVDSTDYACRAPQTSFIVGDSSQLIPETFPRAVAVGSEFRVHFLSVDYTNDTHSLFSTPVTLEGPATPISTDLVTPLGTDRYRVVKAGFLGFYGTAQTSGGPSGGPVGPADILHLEALDPVALQIRISDGTTVPTQLRLYESFDLVAFPADERGTTLGGTVPLSWESSDPVVVNIQPTVDGVAQLVPVNPGQAMITVRTGDPLPALSTQLAFEVTQ
jgi:hypothetical protein